MMTDSDMKTFERLWDQYGRKGTRAIYGHGKDIESAEKIVKKAESAIEESYGPGASLKPTLVPVLWES